MKIKKDTDLKSECFIDTEKLGRDDYTAAKMKETMANFEEHFVAYAFLGILRLTSGYYGVFVTDQKEAGKILKHKVYHIKSVKFVPFFLRLILTNEEKKYCNMLNDYIFDFGHFYSQTYDLANSVQENFINTLTSPNSETINEKIENNINFRWNRFHENNFRKFYPNSRKWIPRIIQGYFEEFKIKMTSMSTLAVCIIARRSTYYSGTRYNTRGLNSKATSSIDLKLMGLSSV